MEKLLWSVYLSLGLALFGLVVFAQCPQDGGCWSCYDTILNCATNGGTGCSSNCVKISPEACSNLVDDTVSRLDAVDNAVTNIRDILDTQLGDLNSAIIYVGSSISNVNLALTALRSFNPSNDVVSPLVAALDSCTWVLDRVDPVDSSAGDMAVTVYSNMTSGAFIRFRVSGRISPRISQATNYIHQAIDSYAQVESDVINTHSRVEQLLVSVLFDLEEGAYATLVSVRFNLEQLYPQTDIITSSSALLRSDITSIDCEPCGSGSGGSSGGGGGGGSTDFTGVSAKLDEIESLLRQIYNLIRNYYTDYDYARGNPIPQADVSYQAYTSLGDNWFSRVEYLLYSVSPLAPTNQLEGAENPELIEGQTAYENNVEELEQTVGEHEQSLTDKVTDPMATLSETFSRLWSRLSVFRDNSQNQDDALLWSHLTVLEYGNVGSTGFRLEAANESSEMSDTFVKIQKAFRFLWFLLTVALYLYFTVSIVKFSFKVAAFVVKLLNTSFGSS